MEQSHDKSGGAPESAGFAERAARSSNIAPPYQKEPRSQRRLSLSLSLALNVPVKHPGKA